VSVGALDRIRRRGYALDQARAARAALRAALQDVVRERSKKCRPRCSGFEPGEPGVLCAACARLSGYEELLG
jgi:hypothetical protein